MQHKIAMKKKNRTKHSTTKPNSYSNFIPTNTKWLNSISWLFPIMKYGFIVVLFLNILFPIVIIAWPNITSHIVFQNFVNFPFKNLSNPERFNLYNAHHFKLEHDNVSLGAWHVLPKDQNLESSGSLDEHFYKNLAVKQNPIIVLYLHGNTFDRAARHRIELYKLFQSLGYHTIAIDYRGYGDSSGSPSEDDVVKDAIFIFKYLNNVSKSASIYVWGHSLGTAVNIKMNSILDEKEKLPDGVILEAPFLNILEEVELHPFAKIWSFNPLVNVAMKNALNSISLHFNSDIHIKKVKSKILILHAEDDGIVPFNQGLKLYEIATSNSVAKSVAFIKFESELRCGHRNIYTAPNIIQLMKEFII